MPRKKKRKKMYLPKGVTFANSKGAKEGRPFMAEVKDRFYLVSSKRVILKKSSGKVQTMLKSCGKEAT